MYPGFYRNNATMIAAHTPKITRPVPKASKKFLRFCGMAILLSSTFYHNICKISIVFIKKVFAFC